MSVRKLLDLTGRTALITGGSRGLGLQMAEALGEMGARLVLVARKAAELAEAAEHLQSQGVDVLTFPCDLGDPAAIEPLVEQVLARTGAVEILMNNAGATWGAPAEELPLEAWQKVLNVNLTGTFLLTQAVGRLSMIPRRYGRIINISSIAGLQGSNPKVMSTLAYNTTKGGVINMTRALAAEWARCNITVNTIAPGFFPTKMTKGTMDRALDAVLERTPLRRVGGDEDLKGAAVLLASDASAYMTGQVIVVDGGVTII